MQMNDKVLTALEVLKDCAENDFERHRIDVLIKDLTAPPKVEIIDDTHQKFNGIIYAKSKTNNHYERRSSIYRAVYNYYCGEIPRGYEIHHKDWNPDNNDISNLQMLTRAQHQALHHSIGTYIAPVRNFICKVCGKKFTSHYSGKNCFCSQKCANKFHHNVIEKECLSCGKKFTTSNPDAKFCSSKCYGKSIKKSPIEKECVICGKKFYASVKHPEKQCCSPECTHKLSGINIRKRHTFIKEKLLQIFNSDDAPAPCN